MTETPQPNPEEMNIQAVEAQDQLRAAIEQGESSSTLDHYNGMSSITEDGKLIDGYVSTKVGRLTEASYSDNAIRQEGLDTSTVDRTTHVEVNPGGRVYKAGLDNYEGDVDAYAKVEKRGGYEHTFTPKNAKKAATLITRLTAKQMVRQSEQAAQLRAKAQEEGPNYWARVS